ncbi:MAG: hypothetical protein IPM74_03735 [Crocinitomicaceae bacterium]|nr:hypothetical protein [Crocinitomicaceae bacterium]MBK8925025.1 hypothetical protein [Crocinitomicaceae bacterium]
MQNKELEQLSKGFLKIVSTSGKEKLILGSDKAFHYTLHFGLKSKILDLHLTRNNGEQKTLIKIPHYSLFRAMVYISKATVFGLQKYWFQHKINVGKLKRYNCILFPISGNDEQIPDFFKIKKGGKHFRIRNDIAFEKFDQNFVLPANINKSKDGAFMVYRYRKGIFVYQGMVIKRKDLKNFDRLYFCSSKNFNSFMKFYGHFLFRTIQRMNFKGQDTILKFLWNNGL